MKRISLIVQRLVVLAAFLAAWDVCFAASVVTPAMAGNWKGTAQVIVSWCHQKDLAVSVDIHADGSVTGKIGDATLINGRFECNRGWLGRKQNLATDYLINGRLDGAIVAAEGIARNEVFVPLDLKDNAFVGGINTSGSFCLFSFEKTRKEKMGFSARSLKLVRSSP